MTCEEFRQFIPRFLRITAAERAAFSNHFLQCDECRQHVKQGALKEIDEDPGACQQGIARGSALFERDIQDPEIVATMKGNRGLD